MSGRPRALHKPIDGVEHKQCFRCKDWFPLKLFGNCKGSWDKLFYYCRACNSKKVSEWRRDNPEKVCLNKRKYIAENREAHNARSAKWHRENRDRTYESRCRYRNKNKKHIRELYKKWIKKKRATEPAYALRHNVEVAVRNALKENKAGRKWEDLLGYTVNELKKRLTKTMPKGYVWQDYLDGKLHIDHKTPVSVFNFEKPEDDDFQRCFALKNLQLLPARENIIKSNKIDRHFQPSLKF